MDLMKKIPSQEGKGYLHDNKLLCEPIRLPVEIIPSLRRADKLQRLGQKRGLGWRTEERIHLGNTQEHAHLSNKIKGINLNCNN